MNIEMVKQCKILAPATDEDLNLLEKLKTGEQYQVKINCVRNPAFHRKTFAFFKFCFDHWISDREFMDSRGQFDVFRKNLTVLAGFYNEYYSINGEVRIEAKSLSFGSMSQDEFEQHYQALIAASVRHIFKDCDPKIENQLLSFF